jgi:hypothetical protein
MKWIVLAIVVIAIVWWYRKKEPPRAIVVVTPPPSPPPEPIEVEFGEDKPIAKDGSKPSDPDKDPAS